MRNAIQAVNLEELESVEEFSALLDSASAAGHTIVLLRDRRVVGTVVPAEMARQMFARTVAEHWAGHPDVILDLEARLRSETPEDWID
jgi:antitoxin (DNA-binding transcriptional repressor) of toxin-antitoxin stability system